MTDNYFGIENPSEWHCAVFALNETGNLRLKLFKPHTKGNRLRITFSSVIYCDLKTAWEGADFQIGSTTECLSIIHSLRDDYLRKAPDEKLLGEYKLFVCTIEKGRRIQIVAGSAILESTFTEF